jgi:hypothetical protein
MAREQAEAKPKTFNFTFNQEHWAIFVKNSIIMQGNVVSLNSVWLFGQCCNTAVFHYQFSVRMYTLV